VANAGTRVSTLEKCRFSITTTPQSTTLLYTPNTCEGHPGRLADFASHRSQLFQFISRRPTLRVPEKGHIAFNSEAILVGFLSQTSDYAVLSVRILYTASRQNGSFLPLSRSSPRPWLPFPRWKTSTSLRIE